MKKINKQQLARFTGNLLCLYLMYAGYSQLRSHLVFWNNIHHLIQSEIVSDMASVGVPVIVLLVALYLRQEKDLNLALPVSAGLMLTFTIFSWWKLMYAAELGCACRGYWANLPAKNILEINLVMLALAIIGAIIVPKRIT